MLCQAQLATARHRVGTMEQRLELRTAELLRAQSEIRKCTREMGQWEEQRLQLEAQQKALQGVAGCTPPPPFYPSNINVCRGSAA